MTVQPTKEMKECYQQIDVLLMKKLPEVRSILYVDVLRECLLHYVITRNLVENFIKEFYIKPGIVELRDGVLYPKRGVGHEGTVTRPTVNRVHDDD